MNASSIVGQQVQLISPGLNSITPRISNSAFLWLWSWRPVVMLISHFFPFIFHAIYNSLFFRSYCPSGFRVLIFFAPCLCMTAIRCSLDPASGLPVWIYVVFVPRGLGARVLRPYNLAFAIAYVQFAICNLHLHCTYAMQFLLLSLLTKSYGVTTQMKPIWQYLYMVPFDFSKLNEIWTFLIMMFGALGVKGKILDNGCNGRTFCHGYQCYMKL